MKKFIENHLGSIAFVVGVILAFIGMYTDTGLLLYGFGIALIGAHIMLNVDLSE